MSFTTKRGSDTFLGRLTGGCALALLVTLLLAGVSPELHHVFHPDADEGTHACVVTVFAQGEGLALPAVLQVHPAELRVVAVWPRLEAAASNRPDHFLQPSCGPPAGVAL